MSVGTHECVGTRDDDHGHQAEPTWLKLTDDSIVHLWIGVNLRLRWEEFHSAAVLVCNRRARDMTTA